MVSTPSLADMVSRRVCYVCLQPIPESHGVYHASLRIIAHHAACSDFVHSQLKDYSRSKRGRFRPPWVVRRLICESRGPELRTVGMEYVQQRPKVATVW